MSTQNTASDGGAELAADPYQVTCPRGHTNWEPVNGSFWCESCSRHDWDHDGRYDHLVNQRTGEDLDRDDVRELEQSMKKAAER